nr:hypothetical protein [Tanacetum cinerariifolium]
YQVTPKECHSHAFKRIFRYLKGHPKLRLWYPKESPFDLVAYSDSDYGGATQDRKSTTGGSYTDNDYGGATQDRKSTAGGCQFLGSRLSKPCEALSREISSSILRLSDSSKGLMNSYMSILLLQVCMLSMPCEALSKEISSFILLFARIETMEEGTKILATVDGKLRTVSESSIRRNLKLNDEAGISSLPDAELFENLQLMRYNILPNQKFTFQKGQFSHQWKYLIHTIMIVLLFDSILVPQGEGLGIPTEPHYTPTSEALQSSQHELPSPSLLPVPTESLSTIIPSDNPSLRQYTRRTRIAQSSDRANIAKTSTLASDSTPRVTSLVADEGSMQQKLNKLMALCTSLQRQQSEMVSKFVAQELEITNLKARVKLLEDREGGCIAQSRDDAPIKDRSLDEGKEAAERVSDDTEEMATVLTSMDAASILISGGVQVVPTATEVATATVSIPTSSGVVSTASPTIPIAALIVTTATESTLYTRRKGKEKMVESKIPNKKKVHEQIDVQLARELKEEMARDTQRMNGQIAQDAVIARIHAEEELQMLINRLDKNNETVAKSQAGWKTWHFKGMTLEEIKEKFDPVWKKMQDFVPRGSKEEGERFKIKGLNLEKEGAKKVKVTEEVPKDKLKEMMQLIPVEEVYVEALQVKHPIINWKVHTEGQRSYWKIIRLGGS